MIHPITQLISKTDLKNLKGRYGYKECTFYIFREYLTSVSIVNPFIIIKDDYYKDDTNAIWT